MTSPLRLYLGLWARMLVASGVTVLGQGFILALECIVIAVIAIQLLSALHVSLLIAFVFGLVAWETVVDPRWSGAAVVTVLSLPAAYAESMANRYDDHPLVVIPGAFVVTLSRWSVAVVSRYREYLADRGAVAITGDPAALASALETLDRDLERRPGTDLREHRSAAAFSIVPPPWEEHRFFDRTRRFVRRRLFGTHPRTTKRIEQLRTRL